MTGPDDYEKQLSEETIKAASQHQTLSLVFVLLAAVGMGTVLAHVTTGDDTSVIAFVVGAVLGGGCASIYYHRVRIYVLDLKRRHEYMNRT